MSLTKRRPGRRRSATKAFTLIELLVVVAIISILASIAMPNFLDAQIRAKVARAVADMRTITTGIEIYMVDHNSYPPNPLLGQGLYVTPPHLTTPIAYITSFPIDPFKRGRGLLPKVDLSFPESLQYYDYYCILTTSQYYSIVAETGGDVWVICVDASGPLANFANRGALEKSGAWMLWSIGPDIEFWIPEDDFLNPNDRSSGLRAPQHLPWGYSFDVPYDPTNGTQSFGNVIRSQAVPDGLKMYRR